MYNSITVVRVDLVASLDGSVCVCVCVFLFFFRRLGCQIASLCFNGMIIIVSYSVHPKPSPAAPSTDWQTHGNLTNLFWPPLNQVVCEIIWLCIFPRVSWKTGGSGFFFFFFAFFLLLLLVFKLPRSNIPQSVRVQYLSSSEVMVIIVPWPLKAVLQR